MCWSKVDPGSPMSDGSRTGHPLSQAADRPLDCKKVTARDRIVSGRFTDPGGRRATASAQIDRLREMETRKEELRARLATLPPEVLDVHLKIAGVYHRKVARLAAVLRKPEERDAAASALRGLIERILLTPGTKRSDLEITLRGDLGTILE